MQPKEAISKAKGIVAEMFVDDSPVHIALEEIEFDDSRDEWKITIGFERQWGTARKMASSLEAAGIALPALGGQRVYKIVRLANDDGHLVSIKNHEPAYS